MLRLQLRDAAPRAEGSTVEPTRLSFRDAPGTAAPPKPCSAGTTESGGAQSQKHASSPSISWDETLALCWGIAASTSSRYPRPRRRVARYGPVASTQARNSRAAAAPQSQRARAT